MRRQISIADTVRNLQEAYGNQHTDQHNYQKQIHQLTFMELAVEEKLRQFGAWSDALAWALAALLIVR